MTTLFINKDFGLIDKAHADFLSGLKNQKIKSHKTKDCVVYFVGHTIREDFIDYCELVKKYIIVVRLQLNNILDPKWQTVEELHKSTSAGIIEELRPFCGVSNDTFFIQFSDGNYRLELTTTNLREHEPVFTTGHDVPYVEGTGGNLACSGWLFGMTPEEICEFVSSHDPFSSSSLWEKGWDVYYRNDLKPLNFKDYYPDIVKGLK